jgi:hypothetical protein
LWRTSCSRARKQDRETPRPQQASRRIDARLAAILGERDAYMAIVLPTPPRSPVATVAAMTRLVDQAFDELVG